ncbi:MAG TPA: TonB-dependent receptor [Gemmatimonadales bacterium]|nr:TonB-dependent receptor [Gemmatimonadales bacterium]
MNVALVVLALTAQQPQDTVILKPVVVTATRIPVPADIVASAVTVIRGADLEAQGIRTVAEALRAVPGATVVETGSFGGQTSLFVRGGESDYVKVLLDGVPLNQAGGGLDFAHLTTDNVERIEIVRGPGSVLYGSDAVTGVIQIFTRTGHGPARLGTEVRGGSYGSTEGAADVAGGGSRVGYSLRVSRFAADGLYPYNNQYRNTVVSARVYVTPDERSEASLTYRYGDDIYHIPTNSQGQPVDSNARSAERGPVLSLALARVIARQLEARVLVTLHEARLSFNDEPDSPGEDGAFWSRDYTRRAAASTMLTWRARDIVSLTGGVEYEDERQRGRSEFSASFGTFPDSIAVQRSNAGYFTQAVVGAGRPVAITLGGRLDDNSQFGAHVTYRGGVVYRLRSGTRLRVSAGTGFKEPTFFENFARGFVQGNPDLAPERSRSWEAGVDRTLAGGRLTVAVTYFNQRFRDLIEFTFTPPPGQPNYFNVAGAVADGVETELTGTVTRGVVARLRYAYLHSRVVEGGPDSSADALFVPGKSLIRRPAHTLAPQITAALGGRAQVTLAGRWVGQRDDLDFSRAFGQRRVTLRPYTRVNLSAEYDLRRAGSRGTGLVLSASVQNAFNDEAQEIPGFRPRGRTVLIGGRVEFGL